MSLINYHSPEFKNYTLVDFVDTRKGKIEYLEEASLPLVRFTFVESVGVRATEAEYWRMGEGEKQFFNESWKTGYYAWAVDTRTKHAVICNFHRYGWSWTRSFDGKYGYDIGVTYAHGFDGGLSCSSPEQVVRETLLCTIRDGEHKLGVPGWLIRCEPAREAFERLLEDALQYGLVSLYASAPLKQNGLLVEDQVSVTGL